MKTARKYAHKKSRAPSRPHTKPGRPLTARAVAELCGVELKTVHNWAGEGRLAHFRTPGRHLRFQPDVVEAFLRECGYEAAGYASRRVVCVAARPSARLRKALTSARCTWVPDVWTALLEIGRSPPDLWLIDANERVPEGVSAAAKVVKKRLPALEVAVLREHASASDPPGLRYVGFEALTRLLVS